MECSIEDCGKPHYGRGWCKNHYMQWRRYGTPYGKARKRGGLTGDGYRLVTIDGQRVREHRKIMEDALGRPLLPTEDVHHKDENRLHNDPTNLEVLPKADHTRLHTAARFRDACGRGHPWTEESTVWHDGRRSCRICRCLAQRRYQAKASESKKKAPPRRTG